MSSTFSAESEDFPSGSNEQECGPSRSARSILSASKFSQSIGPVSHVIPISEISAQCSPTSSAADFPASHSAQRLEDGGSQPISGPKRSGSSSRPGQPTSSQRTSKKRQSPTRLETSVELATARTTAVYRALTQGRTIKETVGGLLHTPTRTANFVAPSMQKWPSCRRFVQAFGGHEITPEQFEFLMGLPIGWTELAPSETRSSRKSRKSSDGQS